MIFGIGHDLVDIRRIEKLLEKSGAQFIERTFTKEEQDTARSRDNGGLTAATYAKRFAAKEACAKALGTAIRNGISFLDFSVTNTEAGKPVLTLSGQAALYLQKATPEGKHVHIHLSLTDEYPYAQAYVIIEFV
jgi:holo-[acyl-carrier protein] synthase